MAEIEQTAGQFAEQHFAQCLALHAYSQMRLHAVGRAEEIFLHCVRFLEGSFEV
ncbi:MAG TPA: hypothetical protein VFW87_03035 [Pirellulales bacterium]|nr:hypothetical protein [Pirellulales bacterium]